MDGFVVLLVLAGTGLVAGTPYHNPHFKPNRSVIVQLFEWKLNDIAEECETFLGPGGFGGVQVSPVNEYVVRKDFARPWWERYHPISYKIISRSGTREEFGAMTRKCNDAGVRIYVDVVINQMAAPRRNGNAEAGEESEEQEGDTYSELMVGTGGSTANASGRDYPAVPYTDAHFHRRCAIVDYTDGHQIRNCEYKQLPDLDHSKEHVKGKIVAFLNELVDLGAAGFRVDAAKYMWPMDLKEIFAQVKNLNPDHDFSSDDRPFVLQEVIDLGQHAISKTEYTSNGVVTDSLHAAQIASTFNGHQPLSSLINWGPAMGFLMPPDALVFVDTHYTQRGHGLGGRTAAESVLTNREPKKYTMAVAFMLAHSYGIKRIMSSFRFESTDEGPPTNDDGDDDDVILSPEFSDEGQCSGELPWVCEHRWNAMANMVAFANHVAGEGVNGFQNAGPNHVAFCRGSKGFVAMNNDPELDFQRRMYACVRPGDYCDVISGGLVDGNCTGMRVTVDGERMAEVALPVDGEHGVLAIHDGSRVEQ